jgi:hypothetical protein
MEVLDMKVLGKALVCVVVLALVGAGTATAAKLVTGGDIAKRTITGKNIKKHTIGPKLLTDSAKASMQGPAGPQGPQGEPGANGADGSSDRYAYVSSTGLLGDDTKNVTQDQLFHTPGTGIYCFTFPADSRPKGGAATGALGDTLAAMVFDADGLIAGCPASANVRVITYDISLHSAAPRSFRVLFEND